MHPLIDTILFAGAATGAALILRAFPWPRAWLARKPFACATCMAVWGALAATLVRTCIDGVGRPSGTVFLTAVVVAALIYARFAPPPPLP